MHPPRRLRLPRLRFARSPLIFWMAVGGLALLTALVVAGALGRADALAARYGPLRPVVVATRPVDRGATVEHSDVGVRQIPAGFATEGSFASPEEVVGRTALVPLEPGAAVVGAYLAPSGLSAPAVLLGPGRRGVSVPTGSMSPPLRRGDVVDILASTDAAAWVVAVEAAVIDVGAESATVSVSPEEARGVAHALASGAVTVVLTPGTGSAGQRRPVASNPSTSTPSPTR